MKTGKSAILKRKKGGIPVLELIVSRDRKLNTDAVLDRIAAAVQSRRSGQILIVPEQFSHDAERAL